MNREIESLIREARARGNMDQEIEILQAIQNGFQRATKISRGAAAEFFKTLTGGLHARFGPVFLAAEDTAGALNAAFGEHGGKSRLKAFK